MSDTLLNKPAFTLSVGELIEIIKVEFSRVNQAQPQQPLIQETSPKYAYSIKEGAEYFKCSPVTFQMWKNSGYVKYTQHGRKLIIDLPGTLELLNNKKRRQK